MKEFVVFWVLVTTTYTSPGPTKDKYGRESNFVPAVAVVHTRYDTLYQQFDTFGKAKKFLDGMNLKKKDLWNEFHDGGGSHIEDAWMYKLRQE